MKATIRKLIFMKTILSIFSVLIVVACTCSCKQKKPQTPKAETRTLVEMETSKGTITLELYNETPQHRDNFIKLIEDGILDSVLFHRVIKDFMIQGGDPDSKNAPDSVPLGNGGLDYRVPPEFHPELFHKKGALAAARDGNPERASSSTQFYIVQGKVFNDSTLNIAEERINDWLGQHFTKIDPTNKSLTEALQKAMDDKNMEVYRQLNDSLSVLAKSYDFAHYTIPEEHRNVYKTLGGTPHLDQNYTVFGQVTKGLDVVDSIAAVETGKYDRPVNNVRILSVSTIKKEKTKDK